MHEHPNEKHLKDLPDQTKFKKKKKSLWKKLNIYSIHGRTYDYIKQLESQDFHFTTNERDTEMQEDIQKMVMTSKQP